VLRDCGSGELLIIYLGRFRIQKQNIHHNFMDGDNFLVGSLKTYLFLVSSLNLLINKTNRILNFILSFHTTLSFNQELPHISYTIWENGLFNQFRSIFILFAEISLKRYLSNEHKFI
jgi:hypothetical protein